MFKRGDGQFNYYGCLICGHDLEPEPRGKYRHLETTDAKDAVNLMRNRRGLEQLD